MSIQTYTGISISARNEQCRMHTSRLLVRGSSVGSILRGEGLLCAEIEAALFGAELSLTFVAGRC